MFQSPGGQLVVKTVRGCFADLTNVFTSLRCLLDVKQSYKKNQEPQIPLSFNIYLAISNLTTAVIV